MKTLKISLLFFILTINISAQNRVWTNIGDEFPGDSINQNFTNVYLYSPYGMWWISSGYYPEIYRTTEFGTNWGTQNVQSLISAINFNDVDYTLLAYAVDGKIYKAADIFSDWELYDSINAKVHDACIAFTYNSYDWTAYICGDSGAVWTLTEFGLTDLNTGLDINFKKVSSRMIDNVWLCGDSLIYYYNGDSFTEKFSAPVSLNSIYFKYPSHIWSVGDNGYIVYSSDNGENWLVQNNPDLLHRTLNDIFFSQIYDWGNGWTVGDNGLILTTTNFGNTWQIEDEGVTENNLIRINFCHYADFFGGSFGPGIIVGEHKTVLLNPIVVSIEDQPKTIENFHLSQNYPNPFNPSTKIKFEIPGQVRNDNSLVTLKVYDILGKEVAILINEEKAAGEYEVEFNGSELPSGIYFYQIKAGSYIQTKKMVLLK